MQLVVFVQPFLPGQTVPGFGVCQTVVDAMSPVLARQDSTFSRQYANSTAQLQATHTPHTTGHTTSHTAEQQEPQYSALVLLSQASITQHVPMHTQVDHHFSHLSCGFCTLYGHAVPPPDLLPLWADRLLEAAPRSSPVFASSAVFASQNYLKPNSRAPPYYYSN